MNHWEEINHLEKLYIDLDRRLRTLEQAILELDAAFRRSGTLANGDLALSRSPSVEIPDRPSADPTRNLPA